MGMGIALVVAEAATTATVISMIDIVDCQEQAGLRVSDKNPVENNRCSYFSYIVIYFFSRSFMACPERMPVRIEGFLFEFIQT